jgi:hypothetical protein
MARSEKVLCQKILGTMESGILGARDKLDKVRVRKRADCHLYNYDKNEVSGKWQIFNIVMNKWTLTFKKS